MAAEHKYTDPESLCAAAEGGNTKLLSAKWLVAFDAQRAEGEPIKRQQDLPQEAFIEASQLRERKVSPTGNWGTYMVLALSYCWLTGEHPDPKGEQTRTLAQVLALMLKQHPKCADVAVFLDFCSLPQAPRSTPEEELAFREGLKDVNLWYAHKCSWVLMLTKLPAGWPEVKAYELRGWPTFERLVSSLIKDGDMALDIGRLGDTLPSCKGFGKVVMQCSRARLAPQSSEAFAQLAAKLHFTSGADLEFVQRKYQQTVEEVLAHVDRLTFTGLDLGLREAEDLAGVLPLARRLQELLLGGNKLGDGGAAAIAHGISGCTLLVKLDISGNQVGDPGAAAIAEVIPGCTSLEYLHLYKNDISDAGVALLAESMRGCAALQDLYLYENHIGNQGATALAQAVPSCPALQALSLGQNHIGAAGANALRKAAQAQGVVYIAGLDDQMETVSPTAAPDFGAVRPPSSAAADTNPFGLLASGSSNPFEEDLLVEEASSGNNPFQE